MAIDPRKFIIKDCDKPLAAETNNSTTRKTFFSALGKIGDVEALNDIGGGKIGEGLRALESVSNSIRDGDGGGEGLLGIGQVLGTSLDNGANWVLDNVGIASTAVQAVNRFNPEVSNRAYGQAKTIYEQVSQGGFKLSDVPDALQDLQNLDILANGIFTPDGSNKPGREERCFATPYAEALAYTFSPKQKFLFIVQFEINDEFRPFFGDDDKITAFLVRGTTRPNIRFEYEEVNLYNFKTKVAKRAEYEPITMRFYDDNQNYANRFYGTYASLISPVTKFFPESVPGVKNIDIYDETGMASNATGLHSASITSPSDGSGNFKKTIFNSIKLYHIFDFGQKVNRYEFYAPKITELTLDDLDMTTSDVTELQIQFTYDSLHFTPDINVEFNDEVNLEELTNLRHPIKPVFL